MIKRDILSVEDAENLEDKAITLQRLLQTLKTDVKRLRGIQKEKPTPSVNGVIGIAGIQLPKTEVPTFDGNILNGNTFWEQFKSSIHNKPQLTDSDKLTYLRDALKDSPARCAVIGLTQTSESYGEAIKCLHDRYD